MKIKEIKEWLNLMPTELLEYDSVTMTETQFNETNRCKFIKSIVSFSIDEETKEIFFLTENSTEIEKDRFVYYNKCSCGGIKEQVGYNRKRCNKCLREDVNI